jgi:4-carboxymuconolactone decarboxylase
MPPDEKSSRLPALEPERLAPARTELYAAITGGPRAADNTRAPIADEHGRLLGPFNAMLFNPELGGPMQALGAAIRYRTSLSDTRREMAILVVAAELDSEFEWFAHASLARAAGVAKETISAIARGQDPDGLEAGDAIVFRAARALVASGDLTSDQFAELSTELDDIACVELVVLVGYYRMLALMLRVFRVPTPDG